MHARLRRMRQKVRALYNLANVAAGGPVMPVALRETPRGERPSRLCAAHVIDLPIYRSTRTSPMSTSAMVRAVHLRAPPVFKDGFVTGAPRFPSGAPGFRARFLEWPKSRPRSQRGQELEDNPAQGWCVRLFPPPRACCCGQWPLRGAGVPAAPERGGHVGHENAKLVLELTRAFAPSRGATLAPGHAHARGRRRHGHPCAHCPRRSAPACAALRSAVAGEEGRARGGEAGAGRGERPVEQTGGRKPPALPAREH